ncbi:MAG: hypothetical protein ISR85_04090 [Kiritimatiellales bacterium]|nr:hypothetical protein [Kiritimatiellota bacterium]MBL7012090.1 hypothetical protein [Kiritimatiellales bacterium]
MLPQHGGVPNFSLRISGLAKALLTIVLICGLMLTLSFYLNAEPGDMAAQSHVRLSLIATLLLSFFVFLVSTGRWWHPHLRRHGNSQQQHRHRSRHHPRKSVRHRHHHR